MARFSVRHPNGKVTALPSKRIEPPYPRPPGRVEGSAIATGCGGGVLVTEVVDDVTGKPIDTGLTPIGF